jgi:hypothetical protein
MDLIKHFGKTKQTNSFLSNGLIIAGNVGMGENHVVQYYQHTPRIDHLRKFSKRENSSTVSSCGIKENPSFHKTSIVANGTGQHTIQQSSTVDSSFKKNSLKIELLTNRTTPTLVKFYPTFTIK